MREMNRDTERGASGVFARRLANGCDRLVSFNSASSMSDQKAPSGRRARRPDAPRPLAHRALVVFQF